MEGGKEVRRKKEKTRPPPREAARRSIRPHAHSHPFEEAQRQAVEKLAAILLPNVPNLDAPQDGKKVVVQ